MSIPPLTSEGLLPQGVYESALDEIAQHFGRFQGSDRRVVLFQALREYLEALTQTHLADHIIVDGSFVTAKDSPNDIDLLVMLRQDVSLSQPFRPFEYNVISKRRVRKRYPFDLFVAPYGSQFYNEMVDFFAGVKGHTGKVKGLLKVKR